MAGFVLILWAYTKNNSALTVSLLSFCNYVSVRQHCSHLFYGCITYEFRKCFGDLAYLSGKWYDWFYECISITCSFSIEIKQFKDCGKRDALSSAMMELQLP